MKPPGLLETKDMLGTDVVDLISFFDCSAVSNNKDPSKISDVVKVSVDWLPKPLIDVWENEDATVEFDDEGCIDALDGIVVSE